MAVWCENRINMPYVISIFRNIIGFAAIIVGLKFLNNKILSRLGWED